VRESLGERGKWCQVAGGGALPFIGHDGRQGGGCHGGNSRCLMAPAIDAHGRVKNGD
jgi:hypothetical protein